MTNSLRAVRAHASAFFGTVLIVGVAATPALAQQSGALAPTMNRAANNAAGDATASLVGQAQAPPAQDPAAKQDSGTMDFFRKTEISGFADMYYTYNVNTPARPCATVAAVAVFNCLYNFNVAPS